MFNFTSLLQLIKVRASYYRGLKLIYIDNVLAINNYILFFRELWILII